MKKNKFNLKKQFENKQIDKSILRQYALIIALWFIVVAAVIVLFSLYLVDMNTIYHTTVEFNGQVKTIDEWRSLLPKFDVIQQQALYEKMTKAAFGTSDNVLEVGSRIPIVWFSNMLFIPNFSSVSDWKAVWDSKLLNVTTCEIYILISQILALIGFIYYIYLVIQYSVKLKLADKKGFTYKYPLYKNDLHLYTNTTYVNFIIAISIFFSFYALSATIIMLIYMIILKQIYKFIEKKNLSKNIQTNLFNPTDLSYFKTLFIVMAVMIAYNGANSFITSWLNVDINAVLNGLFSFGGIAVIIFSLVRSLLSSSITEIRKKMKNIDKQIKEIHYFYHIRQEEAAYDYKYALMLPPVIKKYIAETKTVNKADLNKYFNRLFDYTEQVQSLDMGKRYNQKRRKNFILYRMYNEIDTMAELEDVVVNLNKEFKK